MQTTPRIDVALRPFRDFLHTEASGGILLFLATVAALVWANSPWSASYFDLWHTTLTVDVGGYGLSKDLAHWINDGLMAIFFFVVGLEIKREVLVGELASPRQALLPIACAFAGAAVPALIYVGFNAGSDDVRGWGVPMATDIAFVLGILALLGDRIPTGLKIFLTALAIVDDLIAVLVIALFYTASIEVWYLAGGLAVFGVLVIANRADVSRPLVYGLLGLVLWLAFVKSGVHATIAGVLLALTIPARTRISTREFLAAGQAALDTFHREPEAAAGLLTTQEHQSALQELETATEQLQSPMQRLEHALHPWVAFAIVPLFALANAGIAFDRGVADVLTSSISLGVVLGLVLGKQAGITLAAIVLTSTRLTALPDGVTLRHIYGASALAGIGFTMSLFIGELAFLRPEQVDAAKVGILAASVIAAAIGALVLSAARQPQAETARRDEQAPEKRRSPA